VARGYGGVYESKLEKKVRRRLQQLLSVTTLHGATRKLLVLLLLLLLLSPCAAPARAARLPFFPDPMCLPPGAQAHRIA
jgi:hypothetical protein